MSISGEFYDFFYREIGGFKFSGDSREGAVMTDIATQVSQRYEDLFRVGDNVIEALVTKVLATSASSFVLAISDKSSISLSLSAPPDLALIKRSFITAPLDLDCQSSAPQCRISIGK